MSNPAAFPPAFKTQGSFAQGPRSQGHSLDEMLASYERLVIMETLRRNGWNRRRAADVLKISRRRLTYRMAALHFDLGAIPRDAPGRRPRQDATEKTL